MESETKNLIIILGPTGVGKSATGITLAKKFGGEIINCDSMQVYKGFDIGTDKPPLQKREKVPHHLLDIVDASSQFTAADFVNCALEAIAGILQKKKLPFIVGGTGLYLKALLDGLFEGPGRDSLLRQKLEKEVEKNGLRSLRKKLEDVDPVYSQKIGKNDRIRIVRALEVFTLTGKPLSEHFLNTKPYLEDFHILKIGLKLERELIYKKIEERVDKMFGNGIVQEVEALLDKGVDENSPLFRALGYKHVLKFLRKEISLEEAISLTKKSTRHYAKRQMTWFRKIKGVNWFYTDDLSSIIEYLERKLK